MKAWTKGPGLLSTSATTAQGNGLRLQGLADYYQLDVVFGKALFEGII